MISTPLNSQKEYRVATINLFNFMAPPNAFYDFENIYTAKQWQKKCAWITAFLTDNQPDIVGFQEVFSPDELTALTQAAGYPYFAVLDHPEVEDDFIYRHPVVALASKYPITDIANVQADAQVCDALGLSQFAFSRQPLRVTVNLPQFGLCDCYVIHLKSKRSGFTVDDLTDTGTTGAADFVSRQVLGRWASSLQRGNEASLLCHQMLQRRFKSGNPFLLMGDFNDQLHSDLLAAFHQSLRVYRSDITDQNLAMLNEKALLAQLNQCLIFDSYELYKATKKSNHTLAADEFDSVCDSEIMPPTVRPATHYYGSEGSVLDYILVSSEFDPKQLANLAHIEQYQTFDRHLVRPDYERDSDSTDHAPVMMTFKVR
ncbi:endonuclease/exonuclease/phosphatase family protein [Shewanella gaetbuli]